MLQPFHSPPTCVLFSWMYLQTLRNIYRFLQIAPTQQQLFAELFGKAAAKATKDKATKMTSSFLFIKNQFGKKKKKKSCGVECLKAPCVVGLLVTVHFIMITGMFYSWRLRHLRMFEVSFTFSLNALQHYNFVFSFKETRSNLWGLSHSDAFSWWNGLCSRRVGQSNFSKCITNKTHSAPCSLLSFFLSFFFFFVNYLLC